MLGNLLSEHPVDIYRWLCSEFPGEAWPTWDPKTVLLSLKKPLDQIEQDKLLAVKTFAANTDIVVSQAFAFEKTVLAFNNVPCIVDAHQAPSIEEIAYAVNQLEQINKLISGKDEALIYYGEVPGYVAAAAKYGSWVALPTVLSFASDILDSLNGVAKGTAKYTENQRIVEAVHNAAENIGTSAENAAALIESPEIKEIVKPDMADLVFLVRKLLGALLFDPTLPYKKHDKTAGHFDEPKYLIDAVTGNMYH